MSHPHTFVLICLGNFGEEYRETRHNFGFMLADFISERIGLDFKDIGYGKYLSFEHGEKTIFVFKGKTYMNLSGAPARRFVEDFGFLQHGRKKQEIEFVLAHDDLDIPFGRIKIAKNGGAGGHKGVLSLIQHIGKDNIRIKMGIGKPKKGGIEIADYVLSSFSPSEKKFVPEILKISFDAFMTMVDEGVEKAMSLFNSKDALQR